MSDRTPTVLFYDQTAAVRLRAERQAAGIDGHDEVWEGVYVVSPIADIEHQEMAAELWHALRSCFLPEEGARVLPSVNVSDRVEGWINNFRVPDAAVFLADGPARDCKTHWYRGPDLAVEILSNNDPAYEKMDFYAANGVRELLVIDRDPWAIELYRLSEGALKLMGTVRSESDGALASEVVPAAFRLVAGEARPRIEVASARDERRWLV
jgi:Uma2 family endonuclease